MSEAKDPRGDDHIEELLSQLQGIFGKLSHAEEEESQAKVDPPPQVAPAADPPPAVIRAAPAPPPTSETAAPTPAPPGPPTVPDAPLMSVPVPESAPIDESPPPPPAEDPVPTDLTALPMEADKSAVYSLIFYPLTRENEAKILVEKVQTMTPRFTKVAFQIKVVASIPIDPKGDPLETVLPHIKEGIRAVFIIVERPLDDIRRKTITGGLEPRGVYVQEVPVLSVEKKAFYTDLLLGMVFFYDSLRSGAE